MRRRLCSPLVAAGLAAASALLLAAPAAAHVEPEVSVVPAGSVADVQFTVEHGCEGSPTVKLEFQVPASVTDAQPIDKEGWTGAVVDGVITYTGGSLPDDEESDFGIRFTVPASVGDTLRFPMIQTCEEGQLDWIQEGEDAERPAPAVEIGEPDPTATTVAPTTAPAGASTTTTSEAAPSTTAAESVTTTTSDATATEADDDDDSSLFGPALIAAVVVVLGGGGFLAYRMRRDDSSPT